MRYSELDLDVQIDQNTWAISLICTKGSNHAEIIIEKITEDDRYVMQLTHFRGIPAYSFLAGNFGKVIPPKEILPATLKYDGKMTWAVPRKNAEAMISAILYEHNEQKRNPSSGTPFNIFGRDSVLPASVEDSLDLITVKSETEGSIERAMDHTLAVAMFAASLGASIYTVNPAPFLYYLGTIGGLKLKDKLEIKSDHSTVLFPWLTEKLEKISNTIKPNPRRRVAADSLFPVYSDSYSDHSTVLFPWLTEKLEKISNTIKPNPMRRVAADSLFPVYSDSYRDDDFKRSARPGDQDNCFTWCREKLKIAGIILPKKNMEQFITLTRRYTNPKEFPMKMKFS